MSTPCQPLTSETISAAYGVDPSEIVPLGAGLINQTFLVKTVDGRRFVLQRLHDIFPAEVNEDIEVVTRHLEAKGIPTPRLLRAGDGRLWLEDGDGIWRMMTWMPGISVERIDSPCRARAAGSMLGRFHRALADLDYCFPSARSGIHDTRRHLANLRAALSDHPDHASLPEIEPLAEDILACAAALPALPESEERVVHGDPKISNFIFDPSSGRGVCLVDLDTLNRMQLPLELGDAMRSWCNPVGEDSAATGFSMESFRAALEGYAGETGDWLTEAERRAIVPATMTITLELAARFCADALQDRYFGWDPARFASRSEHNRVRAAGQLAAYRACAELEARLVRIVDEVFGAACSR